MRDPPFARSRDGPFEPDRRATDGDTGARAMNKVATSGAGSSHGSRHDQDGATCRSRAATPVRGRGECRVQDGATCRSIRATETRRERGKLEGGTDGASTGTRRRRGGSAIPRPRSRSELRWAVSRSRDWRTGIATDAKRHISTPNLGRTATRAPIWAAVWAHGLVQGTGGPIALR